METVENTREKLHLEYNARGVLYVAILIPLFLFVIATCFMSSNVSIECVKASGSAIVEEDLCTIVSTTLLGSTSLGSAIFPAFITGNKSALSLKYLEGFSVDEQISTTTDEDGNETVRVSYVLNYHQRVPTSVKTPGLTTTNYGIVYDFGSNSADANDLRRRLQVFLDMVRATPTAPAHFQRSIDERYVEEILALISAGVMLACAYFLSVREVIVVEAASSTLHLATYTWLGVNKLNVVVPLQYVTGTNIEEKMQETRTNGRVERRLVYRSSLQLVRPAEYHGGPPGESYSLDLMLGQSVEDRADAQAVTGVLDGWIRDHRRRAERRAQRARVGGAGEDEGAALLGNGSGDREVSMGASSPSEQENVIRARSRPPTQAAEPAVAVDAAASAPSASQTSSPASTGSTASVAVNEGERTRACVICWDESKEVRSVFLPCKHMVCCEDCADAIDKCPMCRAHINTVIDVFR